MRGCGFGLGFIVLLGCSSQQDRPPYYVPPMGTGGSGYEVPKDNGCGDQPPADAGLCGNEVIEIQEDRPNLYFVLDASGSMGERIAPDSETTKYDAAVSAIKRVLKLIGHRVSYGAAVFPKPARSDADTTAHPELACLPGMQIFETQTGDPIACALSGRTGSHLSTLLQRFGDYAPNASTSRRGTPLSATLGSLVPTLTALSGKTAVILATDGAPNCNPNATCTSDLCETNLAHWQYPSGLVCEEPINCCDPAVDPSGPQNCVDDIATNQILRSLQAASIATYVIGLPSEQVLSSVLDSMAVAGGTARERYPRYYETTDAEGLANTLQKIASSIAISCTLELSEPPPNWAQVAVYFDNTRIPALTDDGWQSVDDSTLRITGSYCDDLVTGNVMQVQIAAGCPVYVN